MVYSVRDGKKKSATFERGVLIDDPAIESTDEENGTYAEFVADETVFKKTFKINPKCLFLFQYFSKLQSQL